MTATNNNATANTDSNVIIREPICDGYEWILYNQKLRIIHSINDDMYQMKSIIEACHSNKQACDWFRNDSAKELLAEFEKYINHEEIMKNSAPEIDGEFSVKQIPYENRKNGVSTKVKGFYCHRLLVNVVAMWASPKYAIYIMKLLDELFTKERNELENKIEEQKPRMVPQHKEKNYKYMIWKEEQPDDPDMILLHLVRRNNRAFSQVSNIAKDEDKCWFFRESLPIAMTPNEDVKHIVKMNLPGSEYDIKGCTILTYKEHLPLLHEKIIEYFDGFQE